MRFVLLLLLSCLLAQRPVAQGDAPTTDPVVLRIQERDVVRSEYSAWLVRVRALLQAHNFADWWRARHVAAEEGVLVDAALIRERVDSEIRARIDAAFGGDEGPWLQELEREHRSKEGRRLERFLDLETQLNLAALARKHRELSEPELRVRWERVYGPEGKRPRVRLIQVAVDATPAPGENFGEQRKRLKRMRGEARNKTLKLREELISGGDFAALARDQSDDKESAVHGGAPPNGFDAGMWTATQRKVIAGLEEGALSQPILARGGYWLVRMDGIEETSFESVRDMLMAELLTEDATTPEIERERARLRAAMPLQLPAHGEERRADPLRFVTTEPFLRIGDESVSRDQFDEWALHHRGEVDALRYAEAFVVDEAALAAGISVAPEEVLAAAEAELERFLQEGFGGDVRSWRASMESQGRSVLAFELNAWARAHLLLQIERLIHLERVITDEDVKREWELQYGPEGRSIRVRWIRLDPELPEPDPNKTADERAALIDAAIATTRVEAEDLRRRIHAGEDFGTLARRHSMDASTRDRGGEPFEGFQSSGLPPEVVSALNALETGQVTEPQRLGTSLFLFELFEVRVVKLEDVAEGLRAELELRPPSMVEIAGLRNELLDASTVEVMPAMFR